ncbi:hypothetical protein [Peromfec virus RodF7_14]|uniref:Uncharacterized protein n=1 Tax=Peromfec virus RodF7_14 TaxID=2929349 RepID=A0A976N300_9VIRU|nr:hypothetical protein [Peromfec virus RodF7_14]
MMFLVRSSVRIAGLSVSVPHKKTAEIEGTLLLFLSPPTIPAQRDSYLYRNYSSILNKTEGFVVSVALCSYLYGVYGIQRNEITIRRPKKIVV